MARLRIAAGLMEPERWERIVALFHQAAELSESERSAFLEIACNGDGSLAADVTRMLRSDGRASMLDRDIARFAEHGFAAACEREFGPYRIRHLLGEGGMGVVYLAEREDLGNQVAIKILRDAWFAPDRKQRFLAEQRTLARLNHPAIARLYDANTLPDGTPWFAMEYVDGVPATEYCSDRECSPADRLKLIRAVAEAVQYAHDHGVIHRDLKPSNILVRADGSVRLLDFGIAKQLDELGRPLDHTRTAFRSLTLAYASPEQIRGQQAGKLTDVYSLGVVLYELLAGRLPFDISSKTPAEAERLITTAQPEKPSVFGRRAGDKTAWTDLDTLCFTAMHKDPACRYTSAAALIADIDRCLNRRPLAARPPSLISSLAGWAQRRGLVQTSAARVIVAALVLIVVSVTAIVTLPRKQGRFPAARSVAVLPLRNATADERLDYLSQALSAEIARTLGYARSLSLRPPASTRKYSSADIDIRQAGRELRAATIVSGSFVKAGDQLQSALNLNDVETGRTLWTDVFEAPSSETRTIQAQIAAKTRRAIAPLLGVSDFVTDTPPMPRNEAAYEAYLHAEAMPDEISTDALTRRRKMDLLNQSLALDPAYAPAWQALAWCYAADGWFGNGGAASLAQFRALTEKAIALDPSDVVFRAGALYYWGTLGKPDGTDGGMSRGQAYRGIDDLLQRRPDLARLHFLASWILRDAGVLEESARECDTSLRIDARDAGARSCGVTFMLLGDYKRAMDFLDLDADSEVSKAVSIDVRTRQGQTEDALRRLGDKPPSWGGYELLKARLRNRPPDEIEALARQVKPETDPEMNFFSAAHLAFAGQTDASLAMLKRAIDGGYCSYPAIDIDPFFLPLRTNPKMNEIRADARRCQEDFLSQRRGEAQR